MIGREVEAAGDDVGGDLSHRHLVAERVGAQEQEGVGRCGPGLAHHHAGRLVDLPAGQRRVTDRGPIVSLLERARNDRSPEQRDDALGETHLLGIHLGVPCAEEHDSADLHRPEGQRHGDDAGDVGGGVGVDEEGSGDAAAVPVEVEVHGAARTERVPDGALAQVELDLEEGGGPVARGDERLDVEGRGERCGGGGVDRHQSDQRRDQCREVLSAAHRSSCRRGAGRISATAAPRAGAGRGRAAGSRELLHLREEGKRSGPTPTRPAGWTARRPAPDSPRGRRDRGRPSERRSAGARWSSRRAPMRRTDRRGEREVEGEEFPQCGRPRDRPLGAVPSRTGTRWMALDVDLVVGYRCL